jgi:GH25 family lysozyme M1 (1,4-beta-N-acetylmuramidase)
MVRQCPELANEDWWAAGYPGLTAAPDYLPAIVGVKRERVLAWQWTGTGRVPGITGNADLDVAIELKPMLVPAPDLWPGHERVGA